MYIFEMMGSIGPTGFNDRGTDVIMLQSLLVQAGFDIGKFGEDHDGIDGWYGDKTRAGVASFQQTQGIKPADGIADKETSDALVKYATENWLQLNQVPYDRLLFDRPHRGIDVIETPSHARFYKHLGDLSIVAEMYEEWKNEKRRSSEISGHESQH